MDRGRKKRTLFSRVRLKQMAMPTIKAMIWFLFKDEANRPMDAKAAPKKSAPRYPPMTGPVSISPKPRRYA